MKNRTPHPEGPVRIPRRSGDDSSDDKLDALSEDEPKLGDTEKKPPRRVGSVAVRRNPLSSDVDLLLEEEEPGIDEAPAVSPEKEEERSWFKRKKSL